MVCKIANNVRNIIRILNTEAHRLFLTCRCLCLCDETKNNFKLIIRQTSDSFTCTVSVTTDSYCVDFSCITSKCRAFDSFTSVDMYTTFHQNFHVYLQNSCIRYVDPMIHQLWLSDQKKWPDCKICQCHFHLATSLNGCLPINDVRK